MSSKGKPETLPTVAEPTPMPAPLACRKPPTLALAPDAPLSEWPHNFDITTDEGRAALINASNVADWIPADGGIVVMRVRHFLAHPDSYIDRETGEHVECTSVVFVGLDGKIVKFRNEWSLRKLHALMTLYKPHEWQEGVPIECYAKKSERSKRMYGGFRVLTQPPQQKEK